ncbi:bifunctional nuclease family protein [Bacteroides caecigallinarum]|uniref:bifunctional nuclease family protein n=1 Tax=Bacteroides caecigallinarum TaxID=1411144 RepID=UPI001957CB98|nr:bifunctional nuclease family protein [Bacteroides caecigallinarum]MBM6883884.1 bifunctional nuclease family protein [Bacteroides caecigallinarum]MBM6888917.1 bifunctional nuclease family protein [Bacteroides caecigallinarum]MCF2553002.1 bifunctional nuclease family protein [Bacteroides caecigallinarum]
MNEVEVRIIGVSDLLRPSTSHALILEEMFGYEVKRRLALIIGAREAADIRLCMHKYDTSRPLTFDLINSIITESGLLVEKAVIYDVSDGIFSSYIYFIRPDGSQFKVDSRTTDAFAMSLKMGFPVYVLEDLLEREKIRIISADGAGFSMPINSVGTDMLKMDLEAAINNEDYERAAMLRDEISRRKENEKC